MQVVGLIYLRVDDDLTGVQDRQGSLFFLVVQGEREAGGGGRVGHVWGAGPQGGGAPSRLPMAHGSVALPLGAARSRSLLSFWEHRVVGKRAAGSEGGLLR